MGRWKIRKFGMEFVEHTGRVVDTSLGSHNPQTLEVRQRRGELSSPAVATRRLSTGPKSIRPVDPLGEEDIVVTLKRHTQDQVVMR